MKITVDTIRKVKEQLCSRSVLPKDGAFAGCTQPPRLVDGIIYIGLVAIHPSTFLDIFGVEKFLAIDTDVSKRRLNNYVKKWEKAQ
jgi:hypothetical protein